MALALLAPKQVRAVSLQAIPLPLDRGVPSVQWRCYSQCALMFSENLCLQALWTLPLEVTTRIDPEFD